MNNLPLISLQIGAPRALQELDKLRRERGDYDFDVRERDESDDEQPPSVLKEGEIQGSRTSMDTDKSITVFVGADDDWRETELFKDEVITRLNSGQYQTVLIRIEEVDERGITEENTGFFIKSKYTYYEKYGFDVLAFFESEVDGLESLEDTNDTVSCQGGFDVVYGVETRTV